MVKPGDRKEIVAYLHESHQISVARACKTLGLSKSVYYYTSVRDDSEVIDKLQELVQLKPNRGFPYYYHRIRNEGLIWNHKRVKRVYKLLRLSKRRKHRRRLPNRYAEPLHQPKNSHIMWSMDFMHDVLANGRKVRILNIIDDYNRQAIAMEVAYSHSGFSVVNILERIRQEKGLPQQIRCDNGPEFLSYALTQYCNKAGVQLKYIQPGKPTQNAYIERFNRTYREDVLDGYMFFTIEELQDLTWQWLTDYNSNHPHQSLNNKSPLGFLKTNQHL